MGMARGVVLGPRGSSELPRSMGGGPHVDATDNIEETRCLTRRIPAPVFVLTPACALRPDKGWAFAVNGPGPWYGLMQLHPHITRSTADATPHRGVHQTLNFVHLQIPVSGASREGGGARGRSKMHANRKIPQSGRETRGQSPEPRRRLPFVSMREPKPRCGPHPHFATVKARESPPRSARARCQEPVRICLDPPSIPKQTTCTVSAPNSHIACPVRLVSRPVPSVLGR